MTHPAVDDLPEEATSTLLGVCEQLSLSRHTGLARWAASVSDALLVRLASVTSGARVDVIDFEPCGPLAWLDAAELKGLHSVVLAGAEASDDESVVAWWVRMGRLIVADFYRRAYEQAAIDAKAAVIEAEEWRLACEARPATDFRGVPPWSGF
jgi:hypothetical protein